MFRHFDAWLGILCPASNSTLRVIVNGVIAVLQILPQTLHDVVINTWYIRQELFDAFGQPIALAVQSEAQWPAEHQVGVSEKELENRLDGLGCLSRDHLHVGTRCDLWLRIECLD
jgi:hypothetical protein